MDKSLKNYIDKKQYENLLSNQVISAVMSILTTFLIDYVLKSYVDQTSLIIWTSIIIFLNIFRIFLARSVNIENKKLFETTLILIGITWGSISFLMINSVPKSISEVVTILIIGYSIGVAFSNINSRLISLVYSYTLIIPFVCRLFIEQREYYLLIFAAVVLFTYFLTKMILILNHQVRSNIRLLFEKEGLLKEIESKREIEKELNEEKVKNIKNSKLASLAEITSGIAHEINNPLAILIGKTQLMNNRAKKKRLKEDELVEGLDKILNVSFRISDIIKTLKGLSRVEFESDISEININVEVSKIVNNYLNTSIKISGEIPKVEFEIDHDLTAFANLGYLDQVITNLISNSLDAIKEKDEKWIKIFTKTDNDFIKICVEDSGDGVTPEIEEKIFEPFYTTKKVGEGSGLGLSLSKSLMLKIKGDLTYNSSSKKYFEVCLSKNMLN